VLRAAPCRNVPVTFTLCRSVVKQILRTSFDGRGHACRAPLGSALGPRGLEPCAPAESTPLEAVSSSRAACHASARNAALHKSVEKPRLSYCRWGAGSYVVPCGSRRLLEAARLICSMAATPKLAHNLPVESDTQRQGAAKRRRRSCAPRCLAAGCGSPPRSTARQQPRLPAVRL
jgi:hypothetical protein